MAESGFMLTGLFAFYLPSLVPLLGKNSSYSRAVSLLSHHQVTNAGPDDRRTTVRMYSCRMVCIVKCFFRFIGLAMTDVLDHGLDFGLGSGRNWGLSFG